MKFENYSTRISTQAIKEAAKFIGKYCKYNVLATIRVLDAPEEKFTMGGLAYQHCPDESYDVSAPSLIKIWVNKNNEYPKQDSYVPQVVVVFQDFEEEFLYVLAHEMRHIDQFWTSLKSIKGYEAEVDAEKFALKVLNLFRKNKFDQANLASLPEQGLTAKLCG